MRLSKLARKLDKTPSEIIAYFQNTKIGSYSSHNNKVTEDHVNTAILHFNPDLLIEHEKINVEPEQVLSDDKKADPNPDSENVVNIITTEPEPEEETAPTEENTPENKDNPENKVEVIRAPKIKLEGVKVVGKIELPESKKVVTKKISEDDKLVADAIQKVLKGEKTVRKKSSHKERATHQTKHVSHRTHSKKELSYEEKLRREEKRKKKNKELSIQQLKKKKKQYYVKNVQVGSTDTPKSRIKKKKEKKVVEAITLSPAPVYKNPIRKFWGWLNGEYDQK